MTVSKIDPVHNYTGNGSTTTFDFDFLIENESELLVQHTDAMGIQTTLTLNIDYTIAKTKSETGSYITFPIEGSSYSILTAEEVISLTTNLPIEQVKEYKNSSKLHLITLEWSLDYITRLIQQLSRQIARAVKVQEGSSQTADELVEALQQAQINAANSAAAANNSASKAATSENAAKAFYEETEEKYNETVLAHEAAVSDINTGRTNISNDITTGRNNIAVDLAEAISDINSQYTADSAKLTSQYNSESTNLKNQYNSYTQNLGNEYQATMKAYDRLYKGVDLEVKFASEIAQYGNVYAWLNARKNAGNYDGIHIGDYFHTSLKAGTIAGYSIPAQNFKCRIIGLNTYKSCADAAIGNMIYVSTDEVIDTPIKWNPTDNNNGTNNIKSPWLASAMYAILNGVNNYDATSGYNKAAHGANGGAGIISLLPSELQAVLKQKRNILDERYSASGLLTGGSGWNWADMGKLWLPNEIEVYGCGIRSNVCQTQGFWFPEAGLSIQFPWFANNCENRIKRNSSNGRCGWWLSSVASNTSTNVCIVNSYGNAGHNAATHASVYAPLCFCI